MIQYLPFGAGNADSQNYDLSTEDTFVFAQTDFQPQNIFVEDNGNVTGFIDWDYTDLKPRYNGWSQQPLWLFYDGDTSYTARSSSELPRWPDKLLTSEWEQDKYRKDYARYLFRACQRTSSEESDWRFTLKNHIFDAVTMAIGRTDRMVHVLRKLLVQYIGIYDWDAHIVTLGRNGFAPGQEDWYKSFFKDLFDCDELVVKTELGLLDTARELWSLAKTMDQYNNYVKKALIQERLLRIYERGISVRHQRVATPESIPSARPSGHRSAGSSSHAPDVSAHSFHAESVYEMGGVLRPNTSDIENISKASDFNVTTTTTIPTLCKRLCQTFLTQFRIWSSKQEQKTISMVGE